MKSKYVVDKDFSLRKVTHSVWEILWRCANGSLRQPLLQRFTI